MFAHLIFALVLTVLVDGSASASNASDANCYEDPTLDARQGSYEDLKALISEDDVRSSERLFRLMSERPEWSSVFDSPVLNSRSFALHVDTSRLNRSQTFARRKSYTFRP